MENKNLNLLRDIAFDVTIDPNNPLHAASAEDVIKVLNAYISSYKSFLAIKLKAENHSAEVIKETVDNTKLLVVNTDFSSYHSSLAPYNSKTEVVIPVFEDYKEDILDADMHSYAAMLKLRDQFSKDELHAIYGPIFSAVSGDYSLKVKANHSEKRVTRPLKDYETYFRPVKLKKKEIEDDKKLYNVVFESKDINSFSTKNIIYSEVLDHATYPYTPDRFLVENKLIILNDTIIADVSFVDDLYFITYSDLNIEVWGETRKDAQDAFDFTFYSLFLNYAEEDDSNLTDDAIQLKNKIITMIRTVK